MTKLEIHQFPCLNDNYGVLVHDTSSGSTASIDAPEAGPIEAALAEKGWTLTHIMNTHHHHDHTGANLELKERHGCIVVGPAGEADRIPGIDVRLAEGDTYDFAGHPVHVLETPGHTAGHIVLHFPEDGVVFAGDTLFALGCGRLFEDDAAAMWNSLGKLIALPADTVVYCGHEYTQANARFAVTVDPDNADLAERRNDIDALRSRGQPTLPTTMAVEMATNPFLRASNPGIRRTLGMESASDAEVFAEIRRRKDNF